MQTLPDDIFSKIYNHLNLSEKLLLCETSLALNNLCKTLPLELDITTSIFTSHSIINSLKKKNTLIKTLNFAFYNENTPVKELLELSQGSANKIILRGHTMLNHYNISGFTNLTSITLENMVVNDTVLQCLGDKLEVFDIGTKGSSFNPAENTSITPYGFKDFLMRNKNLKKLGLYGRDLFPDVMDQVIHAKSLTHLIIDWNYFSDDLFCEIGDNMPNLEILSAKKDNTQGLRYDTVIVEMIRKLKKLKKLCINQMHIKEEWESESLEVLDIGYSSLMCNYTKRNESIKVLRLMKCVYGLSTVCNMIDHFSNLEKVVVSDIEAQVLRQKYRNIDINMHHN